MLPIRLPRLPVAGLDEPAVGFLEKEPAREAGGPADEHVVQPVAGDVPHRQGWALP